MINSVTFSYATKKLVGIGLRQGSKRGAAVFFHTTKRGRAACESRRQVRETCMMPGFASSSDENARLGELASPLHRLSSRPQARIPQRAARRVVE